MVYIEVVYVNAGCPEWEAIYVADYSLFDARQLEELLSLANMKCGGFPRDSAMDQKMLRALNYLDHLANSASCYRFRAGEDVILPTDLHISALVRFSWNG